MCNVLICVENKSLVQSREIHERNKTPPTFLRSYFLNSVLPGDLVVAFGARVASRALLPGCVAAVLPRVAENYNSATGENARL